MSEGPTASDARDVAVGNEGGGREARGATGYGGRRKKRLGLWKLVTEVVFISLGVFLALLADQWRGDRQTQQLAAASLRGFRSEILANRERVASVRDYHVGLLGSLRKYLAADAAARPGICLLYTSDAADE